MHQFDQPMRTSVKLTIWFLHLLPLPVYYGISNILFFLMFYILGYRKEIVRKNLRNAFPEKSSAELKKIEYAFFRHLADYIVESVAVFHMTEKDFSRRFHFKNLELLHSFYQQGKNILLAPGHYGNWEWMSCLGLKIEFTCTAIYKEQTNHFVDDIIYQARTKFGLHAMQYHDAYKYLLTYDRSATIALLFLGDQRPVKSNKVLWVRFLNQYTAAFRGIENMYRKLGGVVLFISYKKLKRGYYEIEFHPLNPDGEKISGKNLILRYFESLEKNIREDPRYYLWSHNRWKYTPPPEIIQQTDAT